MEGKESAACFSKLLKKQDMEEEMRTVNSNDDFSNQCGERNLQITCKRSKRKTTIPTRLQLFTLNNNDDINHTVEDHDADVRHAFNKVNIKNTTATPSLTVNEKTRCKVSARLNSYSKSVKRKKNDNNSSSETLFKNKKEKDDGCDLSFYPKSHHNALKKMCVIQISESDDLHGKNVGPKTSVQIQETCSDKGLDTFIQEIYIVNGSYFKSKNASLNNECATECNNDYILETTDSITEVESNVLNDDDEYISVELTVCDNNNESFKTAISKGYDENSPSKSHISYQCKFCEINFSQRQVIYKHIKECHSDKLSNVEMKDDTKVTCTQCPKKFSTVKGKDKHFELIHANKKFSCTLCSSVFTNRQLLEQHMKHKHQMEALFNCDACKKEFVLKTSLEKHIEMSHSSRTKKKISRKSIECPICFKSIPGLKLLQQHNRRVHNGKLYSCQFCSYKQHSVRSFKRHLAKVHQVEGSISLYKCAVCKTGFQTATDLELHSTSVHNFKLNHLCFYCGKRFACIEMLKFHKKSHRAFTCNICYLGFMKQENYEEHLNTVHSDKLSASTLDEHEDAETQLIDIDKPEDMDIASSKVLEIKLDGSIKIKNEKTNISENVDHNNVQCNENLILHLQQTEEGGLEELNNKNLLSGIKVKDCPKKINCPVCKKLLTTKFLKTHMLKHQGNFPHKCHACDKAYMQGTTLRKHIKNRHPEEYKKLGNKHPKKKKVQCNSCDEVFDDIYVLEEHLWKHIKSKEFECKDCKIKFGMESNLKQHMKSHYFKEEKECSTCKRLFKSIGFYEEHIEKCKTKWRCEYCDKECLSRESYRQHLKIAHSDSDNIYVCEFCDKSYTLRHRYLDHIITHSDQKNFTCTICSKQFKRQRPLNDHILKVHNNFALLCSYCKISFSSTRELLNHKLIHRKEYSCHYCGHVYLSKASCDNHIAVHHPRLGDPPHICPVCKETFYKQANFKSHLVNHYAETPHICQVDGCNNMFKNKMQLQLHMSKSHTEIEFICYICEKKFILNSDLRHHMASHSTGSFIKCHICNLTHNNEAQLQRHLLIHTKEKPFECVLCSYKGTHKSQVTRHLAAKHGITSPSPQYITAKWWRCTACSKMFIVQSSLQKHLEEHAKSNVYAEAEIVKTISNDMTTLNNVITQSEACDWQEVIPLLQLQVSNDANNGKFTDVWQCPSCFHVSQTESSMREHLLGQPQCQENVIVNYSFVSNYLNLAETQIFDEVPNLNNSADAEYIVVKEDTIKATRKNVAVDKNVHVVIDNAGSCTFKELEQFVSEDLQKSNATGLDKKCPNIYNIDAWSSDTSLAQPINLPVRNFVSSSQMIIQTVDNELVFHNFQ